jgi:glycosyltransferase involved in cell wall biosynthesis
MGAMSAARPSGRVPRVSVGIPTYNRAATALRAARSALAQEHPAMEVVVSDDASTDGTPEVLGALAAQDARLRYVRQPRNLGHAENFQAVLDAATGEYFMWLADDDWLDPAYVSRCLAALEADPGAVLVCGLARYHRDGEHVADERPLDLSSSRPGLRVLRYFARVNVNGPLYGVAAREEHARVGFPAVVGGDWLLVAAHAARGRVLTLPDVHVHRSLTGLGADPERLAAGFGLSGFWARNHHLWLAGRLAHDIAVADPAYAGLPPLARVVTGVGAGLLVLVRYPLVLLARRALGPLGFDRVEAAAVAWARRRDRRPRA